MPVRVEHKEGKGRCLIGKFLCQTLSNNTDVFEAPINPASRDIAAGELVLRDVAVAYGPKEKSDPVCIVCLKPEIKDAHCQDCKLFMCRGCQSQSNSVHDIECQFFQSIAGDPLQRSDW